MQTERTQTCMLTDTRSSRLLQYLVVFFVAATLNFLLPRLMPGNPLALLAGVDVGLMTADERAQVLERVGLDRPLYLQYTDYWLDLLRGDFGYSYRQKRPITEILLSTLPWTLLLTGASLLLSAFFGILLGAVSAWRRAGVLDISLLWTMIAITSLPSFWLGMLLISVVSVKWGWLPTFGAITPARGYTGWAYWSDVLRHAILPVTTLAVVSVPNVYLTMRYAMLGVMGEDFIRTARAKGLRSSTVPLSARDPECTGTGCDRAGLTVGFCFWGDSCGGNRLLLSRPGTSDL